MKQRSGIMFPPNDNAWITYIQAAEPNNENPCWVDIVGNVQYPAAFYYLYPTPDPNPSEVAFRMRLNGDPLSNNPNVYRLKEFVWGVTIGSQTNSTLFTILVNASGNTYRLQVKDSTSTLIYNQPIALNDPSQPTDNVRVVDAGAQFPCASPKIPDEDFFLDFTLPTSVFGAFNFVSSTYRLCYFTSTQDNVINKDNVCGMIINPPVGTPVLCVAKQIITGPSTVCTNDTSSWLLAISINNCGTVPVNGIVMTDTLNTSMVFTSPPVFIPNIGVTYNSGTRVVTWNVGTLNVGATTVITINMTGYFTAPGHYVLDSGTVTATGMAAIDFADHGILVYGANQLTVEKQIVAGPLSIERCKISTWTLSIVVTNTQATDIPNVVITDFIDNSFILEADPQLNPSAGTASFSGNEIIWTIDNLAGNTSETLLITVTGFFTVEGHIIFNTGSTLDQCMNTLTFQDEGIDVLPVKIIRKIMVSGDLFDCRTNQLLDGVTATLFDSNCKKINSYLFDKHYTLALSSGTYMVLFEKVGYGRKFLSLILLSDMDITAPIYMAPKASGISTSQIEQSDIDIFADKICEKIDADIVFSSVICLNSAAELECLNDIIDSYYCVLSCNTKLKLVLNLEKNVVYKLDQVKDFLYDVKKLPICFPLFDSQTCSKEKCYAKVMHVSFCKEHNLVYNIAYIGFIAYLMKEGDVII